MTIARALQLDRIGFNVSDLSAATAFYTRALGFAATPAYDADPALASLFGIRALRLVRLHRGRQVLELSACDPPGASYPANRHRNDIWFQHCALATNDVAAAYEQLQQVCFTPISRNGPHPLPGGIVAFKFRDPDGHPLELIQFPEARSSVRPVALIIPLSRSPIRGAVSPSTPAGSVLRCKRAK